MSPTSELRPRLLDAVLLKCNGLYRIKRLGPVSLVKGQAITYLQKSLRLDGWRRVTVGNIALLAQNYPDALAYDRGRGRRIAHGCKMAWGQECDVFYSVKSAGTCTDEQLVREEADELANGYF